MFVVGFQTMDSRFRDPPFLDNVRKVLVQGLTRASDGSRLSRITRRSRM